MKQKIFILLVLLVMFSKFSVAKTITLRDTTNQFNYVIITIPEFIQSCETFKNHKELVRGFNVLITDTNAISLEFNSFPTKQENIRDFIIYAGTFWRNPKPKYFLIAGDLTKIPNFKFASIDGYPETDTARSDYFYTQNNDSIWFFLNFYVGRVAARNSTELTNYFDKVISYENNPTVYQWNNNVLLLAQDEYPNGNIWEQFARTISQSLPSYMNTKYLFESDTSNFYGNSDSVANYVNEIGTSCIFFIGHSNTYQFTHHNMFDINNVDSINNGLKYFITTFLGPQYFSDTLVGSITDKLLLKNNGSIGAITPVGLSYAYEGLELRKKFAKYFYSSSRLSLGEILDSTYHALIVNDQMKRLINIFGDPSLKLKYNTITGVGSNPTETPVKYFLSQNFPNPFNPTTLISFSLPQQSSVILKVYNIFGQEVATLISNKEMEIGNHEIEFDGSNLSSGMYFYRLTTNTFSETKKMILLK